MLVQLLALYTDPVSHNAQRHRPTDRRTDYMLMPISCVAVRSAKKHKIFGEYASNCHSRITVAKVMHNS